MFETAMPAGRKYRWRRGAIAAAIAGAAVVSPAGVGQPAAHAATADGYHALSPARVLDTRVGLGAAAGAVGAGQSVSVDVTGVGGVPESGVAAVVLNVTAAEASAGTFVTVWPSGEGKPATSNLNVQPGVDTPNLVIATVGADGRVSLGNEFGSVQLIADVAGWFPGTPSGGGRLYFSCVDGLESVSLGTLASEPLVYAEPEPLTGFDVSLASNRFSYSADDPGGIPHVYVRDIQSKALVDDFRWPLGDDPYFFTIWTTPELSPDGTLVAARVSWDTDDGEPEYLEIVDADGELVASYPGCGTYCDLYRDGFGITDTEWAPNGDLLVLIQATTDATRSVGLFRAPRAKITDPDGWVQIAEFEGEFLPFGLTVSGDGATVGFVRDQALYVMPLQPGANPRQVAFAANDLHSVALSPSGDALAVINRTCYYLYCSSGEVHIVPTDVTSPTEIIFDGPTKLWVDDHAEVYASSGLRWAP